MLMPPLPAPSFATLLSGQAETPAIVAFLQDLSARGESAADLVALVQALRAAALPFPAAPEAIDVCGTGGDGLNTPNISTAVALTVAACGVPVVKHGNRAASSQAGSADVLEALGVNIAASPAASARALSGAKICFLFARAYHPAMRHVAAARQQIGKRTIFNLAGPLANPAQPRRQLIGVYDRSWLRPMAEALRQLGSTDVWAVHSRDGMDEISTLAPTDIVCLRDGLITEMAIDPAAYGLQLDDPGHLRGGDAAANAAQLRALFSGAAGPLQDIVALNSAAALVIAKAAPDITAGLVTARQTLSQGRVMATLNQLIELTRDA